MKLRNIFALLLCALVALVSSSAGSASWRTVAQNNPTGDVGNSKAVHVVCAYPQGQPSDCTFNPYKDGRSAAFTPKDVCDRVQGWLRSQSGGMTFRFDSGSDGRCDVTSYQLSETAQQADVEGQTHNGGQFLVSVNTQLVSAKLDPKKLYLVLYTGPMSVGCDTSYANRNTVNGDLGLSNTGVIYLIPPCMNGMFNGFGFTERLALKVVLSTMGLASACAPHIARGTGLVTDPQDIITITGNQSWWTLQLDPGHDDYFMANLEGCAAHPAKPLDLSVMPYVQWPLTASVKGSGSVKLSADTDGDGNPDQQLVCTSSCDWNIQGGLGVTLTATAAVGSRLVSWGGCEIDPTSPITCRTTANQSRQVSVSFEALAKPGPNLSVSISGRGKVEVRDSAGRSYTLAKSRSLRIAAGRTFFQFVPAAGWAVKSCNVPGSVGRCAVMAGKGRSVAAAVGTNQLKVQVTFSRKKK